MLDHLAEVAPEAILVELFAGLRIPQPAAIGRELVAEHELAVRIVERMAELELVIDEVDAGVGEHRLQDGIDAMRDGAHLADLVAAIDENGVSAVFAESSSPDRLMRALAEETDTHVEVIELYTESLTGPGGGAEDYLTMMRENTQRIVTGLSQ